MTLSFDIPRNNGAPRGSLKLTRQLPTLTTDRLILRAPRVADFDCFSGIACTPRGAPLGGPMSLEAAWEAFAPTTASWSDRGPSLWTIGHAGTVAGFIRLGLMTDDSAPHLSALLTPAMEGQGIAFDAARAARAYAFETLGWEALESHASPLNTRATALAKRLGGFRAGTRNGAVIWRFDAERAAA